MKSSPGYARRGAMQSASEAVRGAVAEGSADAELPRWLWLGVPLLVVVAMGGTALVDPDAHRAWFKVKEGPIEWATVAVLIPAMAAAVAIWRRRALLPARWLGWWMALVGLGSFYYAGEEISWGQHVFGWETPEVLAARNDQRETNLHNLVGLGIFEEAPRFLLEQWVLWGGGVLVLADRWRGVVRDTGSGWDHWFWPTRVCLPTALLAILIRVPDRIDRMTGKELSFLRDLRLSEPQELYFALFLAMYLLSAWARLRRV